MKNEIEIVYAEPRRSDLIDLASLEAHGIKTVAEVNNETELIKYCRWGFGDVLLLDLELPSFNGGELLDTIIKDFPLKKIIIISLFSNTLLVNNCIRRGAKGFYNKIDLRKTEIFAEGIRRVAKGKSFILTSGYDDIKINKKQEALISLICEGKTNFEIAAIRGISLRGVEKQRQQLYCLSGAKTQAELFKFIYRNGLDFLK